MNNLQNTNELKEKYPWLKISAKVEDYVKPNYYDKLLKESSFSGKSDLDLFEQEVKNINNNNNESKILELGCGTGRGTKTIIDNLNFKKLVMVDLSRDMIAKCKSRFSEYKNIEYNQSDSLDFLKSTDEIFDFIFSLWSYSHSVYQLIERVGLEEGLKKVRNIIKKVFNDNMVKGSKFFLIHSDWLSDEQRILIKQWGREMPNLYKSGTQGISKLTLDSLFDSLSKNGLINYSVTHYLGDPIEYNSIDEALEIFINFHLESYFNNTEYITEVFNDLYNYLIKFQDRDGKVWIRPACFIYRCTRL